MRAGGNRLRRPTRSKIVVLTVGQLKPLSARLGKFDSSNSKALLRQEVKRHNDEIGVAAKNTIKRIPDQEQDIAAMPNRAL
jgi:hypothetical protein